MSPLQAQAPRPAGNSLSPPFSGTSALPRRWRRPPAPRSCHSSYEARALATAAPTPTWARGPSPAPQSALRPCSSRNFSRLLKWTELASHSPILPARANDDPGRRAARDDERRRGRRRRAVAEAVGIRVQKFHVRAADANQRKDAARQEGGEVRHRHGLGESDDARLGGGILALLLLESGLDGSDEERRNRGAQHASAGGRMERARRGSREPIARGCSGDT